MRRAACALAALGAVAASAAALVSITPFSSFPAGSLRPLVDDAGEIVLRVRSEAAAGSAAHALSIDPMGLALSWRWKVDRVVEGADLARKEGDDFAARVYVFFDLPRGGLAFPTRAKLALADILYGETLPTAALCYVWDNRHPVGTSAWNPYAGTARTIVLRSGNAGAGAWQRERCDLAADFRSAFARSVVPRVTGIAAGNDTDQTGESATAWFGDFRLEALP